MFKSVHFLILVLLGFSQLSFGQGSSLSAGKLKSKVKKAKTQTKISFKSKSAQLTQGSSYRSKTFNEKVISSKYASWAITTKNKKSTLNVLDAWKIFEKKKEIVVAVVDTGIDNSHPFLTENITTKEGILSKKNYGVDFSKGNKGRSRPFDDHGHGTHIAGIIKSVFPGVKILPLKYYNRKAKDQDNLDSTIAALQYAVDQNVDIINYSSGGAGASLEELRVLKAAEKKGILVVAAAGNYGVNIDKKENSYYPASYNLRNIITVVNHDINGKLNSSSNWGRQSADVSAPGSRIKSSLPHGRAGYLTGTSQSTAFVTGVAALVKASHPGLNDVEIKNIIINSARKMLALKNRCRSEGMVDASRALNLAKAFESQHVQRTKRKLANQ